MKLIALTLAIIALALPHRAVSAEATFLRMPSLTMPAAPEWLPRDFPVAVRHYRRSAAEAAGQMAIANSLIINSSVKTIPLWRGDVTSGDTTFKYLMVGKNPQIPLTNPVTRIRTVIIPVVFTFSPSGAVFDPTAVDAACSPDGSAVDLTLSSPVFSDVDLVVGGTSLGTGQYSSIFQRANFSDFTGPDGINPDFMLTLVPKVLPALQVPVTIGSVKPAICGSLGLLAFGSWDNYVRNTIFPQLSSVLTPGVFPLFVFSNVVMYQGGIGNCCILGYHNAFLNPSYQSAMQTYAVAEFDSSQEFGDAAADIATLTHEVNEWQDDPIGTNKTPSWGNIGQVIGCSSVLEVGDPLTGTVFPVTMPNGHTYHVQDLAFLSWFFRQVPSMGLDGLYSLLGTFTGPADPC